MAKILEPVKKRPKKIFSLGELLKKDNSFSFRRFQHAETAGHRPLKSTFRKDNGSFDFIQFIQEWKDFLGPPLNTKTSPLKLSYGKLIILCEHAVYAQQLSLMKGPLTQKIKQRYPQLAKRIKDIRFQVSTLHFKTLTGLQKEQVQEATKEIKRHEYCPDFLMFKESIKQKYEFIDDQELKEIFINLELQRYNADL